MMKKLTSRFSAVQILLLTIGIACSLYVAKLSWDDLFDVPVSFLSDCLARHGDIARIRDHAAPVIPIADSVKARIPPDACVEVSQLTLKTLLSLRYYLYPIKVVISENNDFNNRPRVCNGRYFIDVGSQIEEPPEDWRRIDLPQKAKLYAIGDSPVDLHRQVPSASPWSLWAFLCFSFIVFSMGLFLLCSFFPHAGDLPLSGKLGGAFLFGFVGETLVFWVLSLFRVPLTEVLVCGTTYGLLFLSYFVMKKQGGSVAKAFPIPKATPTSVLCHLVGLAGMLFFFLLVVSYPVTAIDEVHIYLLKAKIFLDHRMLDFDYTEISTNSYPVFWPLYLTLQFIFTAGDHDQIAKLSSALVFMSSLGLMKSLAIGLGFDRRTSWLVVGVFLIFFHYYAIFTALAENISVALMLAGTACLIDWFKSKSKGSLYATVFILTGMCGVKYESLAVVGIFFLAAIFSENIKAGGLWQNIRSPLPLLMAALICPLWLFWLDLQGVHSYPAGTRGTFNPKDVFTTIGIIWGYFAHYRISLYILLLAIFFPLVIRNPRRWSPGERFLMFLTGGLLLYALINGLTWTMYFPDSDMRRYYPELLLRLAARAMPSAVLVWMSRTLLIGKLDK